MDDTKTYDVHIKLTKEQLINLDSFVEAYFIEFPDLYGILNKAIRESIENAK